MVETPGSWIMLTLDKVDMIPDLLISALQTMDSNSSIAKSVIFFEGISNSFYVNKFNNVFVLFKLMAYLLEYRT